MKAFVIAVLACCIGAITPREVDAQGYTFAAMRWGLPEDSAKAVLRSKGYNFVRKDDAGDYLFRGTILDGPAVIWAMMYEGRLAKVQVTLVSERRKARRVYDEMKSQLTEKYGPPKKHFEFFESPYEEGDGYEDTAIGVGKGHFMSMWTEFTLGGDNTLGLTVVEAGNVVLEYESPKWADALKKRKKKDTRDF